MCEKCKANCWGHWRTPGKMPQARRDREYCELQYIHSALGRNLRHRRTMRTTELGLVLVRFEHSSEICCATVSAF